MSRVVAAVFDDDPTAERAMDAVFRAGFARNDVVRFVVNPPGRHHRLPMGGDEVADKGARGGEKGAMTGVLVGAGVGAVAGLVAMPLIGPLAVAGGLAAGAYAGSLAGAVSSLGDPVERGKASNVTRPPGVMVAVHVRYQEDEARAASALRDAGAHTIEWNDGLWRNGRWVDFDPVAEPQRIVDFGAGRGSGGRAQSPSLARVAQRVSRP